MKQQILVAEGLLQEDLNNYQDHYYYLKRMVTEFQDRIKTLDERIKVLKHRQYLLYQLIFHLQADDGGSPENTADTIEILEGNITDYANEMSKLKVQAQQDREFVLGYTLPVFGEKF